MADDARFDADGTCFPVGGDGQRSTTATGRAVFADSVRQVDPPLAARIEHTDDWRSGYLQPLRDIVLSGATAPGNALTIAEDGLTSAHRRFGFVRAGRQTLLSEAMQQYRQSRFASVTVRGDGPRELDLSLPYGGRRLAGDHLRAQIDRWVAAGIAEPGFGQAIHLVLDNPDWLDLSDADFAILGAGAEMGPTRSLLRWGATVHAVDLPRPDLWHRLISTARTTAGTLRVPVQLDDRGAPPFVVGGLVHPDDDANVTAKAGADLLRWTPELARWLEDIERPFVLGSYAYADGADHALLSMAADAVAVDLLDGRDDVTLAYLATPTDVYMVPMSAVEESRQRWDSRGIAGLLQGPLRLAGQFEPNYPRDYMTHDGLSFGLNDSLVPQQGPSYALAKRLQRWRALVARAHGTAVSLNLAPSTRTQSVIRNRALAAAYAGAGRFGIEVFEPATSSTLMAAMLVHDLRNPRAAANPSTPSDNPTEPIVQRANHGGLWRTAYSPRSVLGFAAVLGMIESRT